MNSRCSPTLAYFVLISNPRGSTGYGGDFGNAIQYAYPGVDYGDLMAVLDSVTDRREIDPERLGVAGGSGGGLLTAWVVSRTDRFKAASMHRSVTNWLSFVGTAGCQRLFCRAMVYSPSVGEADEYLQRSPLSFVANVNTPVQVIHSDSDYRTPLEQGCSSTRRCVCRNKLPNSSCFRANRMGFRAMASRRRASSACVPYCAGSTAG